MSAQGWEMLEVSGPFPCPQEGATAQVGQVGFNTLPAPGSKLLAV